MLPPLVVDLDGTLVKTDLLFESLLALLKQQPSCLLVLPVWLARGKAYLKQQVARRVALDAAALPYRNELLKYVRGGGSVLVAVGTSAAGRLRVPIFGDRIEEVHDYSREASRGRERAQLVGLARSGLGVPDEHESHWLRA